MLPKGVMRKNKYWPGKKGEAERRERKQCTKPQTKGKMVHYGICKYSRSSSTDLCFTNWLFFVFFNPCSLFSVETH